jgi:hypothetical protein
MPKTHMLQLDPPIPVVTADGEGEAIGWMDYSKDDDLMWIVFLKKNGECWIYPNAKVRAVPNITFNRMPGVATSDLVESLGKSAAPAKLRVHRPRHALPRLNGHGMKTNGHSLPGGK